jgi:hypothetical protein
LVSFLIEARAYLPSYHLSSFEFWMNHYTGATEEEKSTVRSRIVGKKIPRSEYQRFFPIGGGVEYTGSHYVFAHYSPDLDTTVASFATFLAAFGAKVGKARHHWVIPGGPPRGSKEMDFIFRKAFGEGVFSVLSSDSHKVPISSLDLLSHQNMVKKKLKDPYFDFSIERGKKAVVLVDDEGCYIGDWRDADGEFVDAIVNRFFSIFMEHSNGLQNGLISLFAKKPLTRRETFEIKSKAEAEDLAKRYPGMSVDDARKKKQKEAEKYTKKQAKKTGYQKSTGGDSSSKQRDASSCKNC